MVKQSRDNEMITFTDLGISMFNSFDFLVRIGGQYIIFTLISPDLTKS